jgi:membrane protein
MERQPDEVGQAAANPRKPGWRPLARALRAARRAAEPVVREAWLVVRATVAAFTNDRVMRLAAAVSFYTALSLAPILVVILSVTKMFWRDEEARLELARHIDEIFGPQAADSVHVMLASVDTGDQSGLAALIGVGALLFGASLLFAQLQEALNDVWHVEPKPGRQIRRFLRKRMLSLLVVLGLGLLLLASLLASSILNAIVTHLELAEWAEAIRAWRIVTVGVTITVASILFALLFVMLPDAVVSWRDVWIGAVITATLFTLGNELIAIYLGTAAVGSGYGAAGSLVAMLVWVYLSAIVFFLGAELTFVIASRYGRGIRPTEDARWIPGTPEAEAASNVDRAEA